MSEWKTVSLEGDDVLGMAMGVSRLEVPLGWLVRTTDTLSVDGKVKETSSALCFVPDKDHAWKL